MQYLKPIKGLLINEKRTLAGKFMSFLGGKISQGWKKLKLKDLSIQWTQEYAKAMDKVLKDRLDNILLDTPDSKTSITSKRKPSNKKGDDINSFIDKLSAHTYMMHILDTANSIVNIINSDNESKFNDANNFLTVLKDIDTNMYDKYFAKNTDILKFLHSLLALDNINKSSKSDLSPYNLNTISQSLDKLLTKLSDSENIYETKINEYIKTYKEKLDELDKKISSENDDKNKSKLEQEKKEITDLISGLTNLSKQIGLIINEAVRTGTFSAVNGILSNLKDKSKAILNLGDTIGNSIDSALSSVGDDISKMEITDEEKKEITNNVNIKRLKVIQFTAETIYKSNTDSADIKLKNYWNKLLLEMDDKFQNAIDVDKVKEQVKSSQLDKKVESSIKIENELIDSAEDSGITFATNDFKKIDVNVPVIMGVRSVNNKTAFLILKKVQKGSNWFMLLNVYDKDKKVIKDFFGKGVNDRYLNNDIPIYINTEIKSGNKKVISLLYNYTNGNIYNNTKEGATYEETEKEFKRLGIDTTRKFMSLTYKDIKPDTNKRTFNIVVSGISDDNKIKEVYNLDSTKYKTKKASFVEADKNHKQMINFFNGLIKK